MVASERGSSLGGIFTNRKSFHQIGTSYHPSFFSNAHISFNWTELNRRVRTLKKKKTKSFKDIGCISGSPYNTDYRSSCCCLEKFVKKHISNSLNNLTDGPDKGNFWKRNTFVKNFHFWRREKWRLFHKLACGTYLHGYHFHWEIVWVGMILHIYMMNIFHFCPDQGSQKPAMGNCKPKHIP